MYIAGITIHLLLLDAVFGFGTLKESVQVLYAVWMCDVYICPSVD
jgi:hypothetical protein